MRDLLFIFDARKRSPELFKQGALVTSKGRAATASAGEIAQVDKELPVEATTCIGRGLGEESCKQHHRDCYAHEDGKRRVEKRHGIIGHHIGDVRCEGEVHDRQAAERADCGCAMMKPQVSISGASATTIEGK